MTKGTFKKIGKSRQRMYGPRGILACGYPPGEQSSLLCLLEQNGFKNLPMIFATDDDSTKTLKELLVSGDRAGLGERSGMRRAIIMSGFTQKELYRLMAIYRLSEFPAPPLGIPYPHLGNLVHISSAGGTSRRIRGHEEAKGGGKRLCS
jgi:hypothetical protein